tara:strand:- start:1416 stop:3311 length:1896 start_codon:yes stop_codon:yes gene_type:complete
MAGMDYYPAMDQESALDQIAEASERIPQVRDWLDKSKKARENQADRWRKNERLYYGRHWANPSKGTESQSRMIFNFPLAVVETILPIINDFQPTVDVMPQEKNDIFFADMMQKRFQQIVEETNLYGKIIQAVKDSLIYSNGFLQILPVVTEDGVFKSFDIQVIDPFTVVPHPYATDLDLKAGEYFMFAVPMETSRIFREFGVKAPADGKLDEYKAYQKVNDNGGIESANVESEYDMALVIECYSNEADKEKYPYGRHTVVVGDKLVVDEPLELYRMPVFMVSNYKSPHNFWGQGETDLVRTQTKAINETFSSINENIRKMGYPIRKVTQRAKGQMTRPITGAPGEEITVVDPSDVTFETPPPIPGYIQNYIAQVSQFMESITGVNDVTQGRSAKDLSGRAIVALQEASQTRIRFKINNEVARLTKEIGEFMVQMILTFDEEIRSIRERDAEGQFQFTDFNPMAVYDADGNLEGTPSFDPGTAKRLQDSEFDVDVTTGSRYAQGRVANEERALELFQLGVYGIEEVVNALNVPDKQDIIQSWYVRNQQVPPKQQVEQAEMMQEQLSQLVAQVMQEGPGGPGEEALAQMVMQNPALTESPDFQSLPGEIQERIITVAGLVGGQEDPGMDQPRA